MKVIILAAGVSKRIAPFIGNKNKTLLEIGGQTILGRMVRSYVDYGFDDFIIVTGHGSGAVEEEMGCLSRAVSLNFETVFNSKDVEINNCYSLLIGLEGLDEGVLVSNKDIVFDPKLLERVRNFEEKNFLVIDNIQPLDEEDMKVYVEDGRVVDISKELDIKKGYGEYMGISGVKKESLPALRESLAKIVKESPNLYYEDGYRLMLKTDPFYAIDTGEFKWAEIDTLEDLELATKLVEGGF